MGPSPTQPNPPLSNEILNLSGLPPSHSLHPPLLSLSLSLCFARPLTREKGTWTFPGGHLDFGESLFGCAERETLEESGLVVRGVGVIGVTNDFFVPNQLHYITVWVRCQRVDQKQEPQVSYLPTYLPTYLYLRLISIVWSGLFCFLWWLFGY